jgi:hypothetical protein
MQIFRRMLTRVAELARKPWLRHDGTWALGLFLACLVLYWPTLSPSVVIGDGGEFQMVSYVLGVPHRTGYPLFVLLGWVVTHLPLGGDVAYRLTLFSMFNASVAMAVFYLLLRELDVRKSVAALSTLLLAAAPGLWVHAAAAEVYTLAVLFVVLGSWLLLRWGRGKTPLWVVTLVFGLGLTHHVTFRLLGPAVLVYLLLVEPRLPLRPRQWLPALVTLLLPLSLYAWIPPRAAHFEAQPGLAGDILGVPKVVASGYVSAWYMSAGVVDFFLVTDYSGDVVRGLELEPAIVSHYLEVAQQQYPALLVLPLALLGLAAMLRHRTRAAVYFFLVYLVTTWAAIRFLGEVGGSGNQLLTAHVLTILCFAAGANLLLDWLHKRWQLSGWKRLVPLALLACVPLFSIIQHYPDALARRQLEVKSQAQAILELPLPEGAVISGEEEVTPIRYLQRIDGVRPDLWVIHSNEPGIRDVLLPRALAAGIPLYALRGTAAGLRLLPLMPDEDTAIAVPTDMRLGQIVRWRGYDLPEMPVAPGTALPITLYWQVEAPIDQNWKTFIHLLDETGAGVAQVDRVPLEEFHPPTTWQAGHLVVDQYELLLPPDLAPGRYQLIFGWYNESERLVWEDGQDSQTLGYVEVAP